MLALKGFSNENVDVLDVTKGNRRSFVYLFGCFDVSVSSFKITAFLFTV